MSKNEEVILENLDNSDGYVQRKSKKIIYFRITFYLLLFVLVNIILYHVFFLYCDGFCGMYELALSMVLVALGTLIFELIIMKKKYSLAKKSSPEMRFEKKLILKPIIYAVIAVIVLYLFCFFFLNNIGERYKNYVSSKVAESVVEMDIEKCEKYGNIDVRRQYCLAPIIKKTSDSSICSKLKLDDRDGVAVDRCACFVRFLDGSYDVFDKKLTGVDRHNIDVCNKMKKGGCRISHGPCNHYSEYLE